MPSIPKWVPTGWTTLALGLPGAAGLNVTTSPASLPAVQWLEDEHATVTVPGTEKIVVGELASATPAKTAATSKAPARTIARIDLCLLI